MTGLREAPGHRAPTRPTAGSLYDAALRDVAAGAPGRLTAAYRGDRWALPVERWYGDAEATDLSALDRLLAQLPPVADVLDLGCGPGRHTAALHGRGHRGLGVDTSEVAVELARRRGAAALQADALGRLPGADAGWDGVLLLDGNVGIGGDPFPLLCRVRDLLRPTGRVLVELDRPGRCDRGAVRLLRDGRASGAFPWARLDGRGLAAAVAGAGLDMGDVWTEQGRWFALAARPA